MCVWGGACVHAHIWRPEDNLLEFGLSFHHLGPGNQTQVFMLDGRFLFWLSHVTSHNLKLRFKQSVTINCQWWLLSIYDFQFLHLILPSLVHTALFFLTYFLGSDDQWFVSIVWWFYIYDVIYMWPILFGFQYYISGIHFIVYVSTWLIFMAK